LLYSWEVFFPCGTMFGTADFKQ